jgi:hypothetical protein
MFMMWITLELKKGLNFGERLTSHHPVIPPGLWLLDLNRPVICGVGKFNYNDFFSSSLYGHHLCKVTAAFQFYFLVLMPESGHIYIYI